MRSERGSSTARVSSARRAGRALAFLIALALAVPAPAQDRTPLGAEVSGNAAGTIPPWQGGLKSPLPGHRSGGPYADPYEADVPMFAISAANLEQHRAQLSPDRLPCCKSIRRGR
jgi:hypothetical protein